MDHTPHKKVAPKKSYTFNEPLWHRKYNKRILLGLAGILIILMVPVSDTAGYLDPRSAAPYFWVVVGLLVTVSAILSFFVPKKFKHTPAGKHLRYIFSDSPLHDNKKEE